MSRRFTFTVTITDSDHRVVTTVGGRIEVLDGTRTIKQICDAIVEDLPSHLRQRGYDLSVNLQQV